VSTIYAPNTAFAGTILGVTFTGGQGATTDAWKLAKFTEWGFGIGSAATEPKPATVPASAGKDFGIAKVTGSLVVKTGLNNVEAVVAAISEAAAYGSAEVVAVPSNQTTNPGEFTLNCYTNAATPAASPIEVDVSWVAFGT